MENKKVFHEFSSYFDVLISTFSCRRLLMIIFEQQKPFCYFTKASSLENRRRHANELLVYNFHKQKAKNNSQL